MSKSWNILLASLLVLSLPPGGVAVPPASAAAPAAPQSAGLFTVTSLADTNASDSVLTLREALLVARGGTGAIGLNRAASAGEQAALAGCVFSAGLITGGCGAGVADAIVFAGSLGVNPVITLTSALPPIDDVFATVLDGAANGVFPILAASGLVSGTDGLTIVSNSNTLQGLTLTGAPRDDLRLTGSNNQVLTGTVLLKAGQYGLHVSGGQNNTLAALLVGAPSAAVASCSQGNGQGGVVLDTGAAINTITGTTVACNTGVGVRLDGASSNLLEWSTVISQTGNGVELINGAASNEVAASTLTGSGQYGLFLSGAATQGNVVAALGLSGGLSFSANWTVITRNTRGGARLEAGAHDNTLDGAIIGTGGDFLIGAPNTGPGVDLEGAPNNSLGTHATTVINSNVGPGVVVSGTVGNVIGGLLDIGSNTGPGVELINTSGPLVYSAVGGNLGPGLALTNVNGGTIQPAFTANNGGPGVVVTGSTNLLIQPAAVGNNAGPGIALIDTSNTAVQPQVVWGNTGAGIAVTGNSSTGDLLVPVSVYGNGGLPVDLGNDGPTPNGAHTPPGPDDWLPYPVVPGDVAGDSPVISGTACLNCAVLIYAAGGGAAYLQSTLADGAGHWSAALTGGYTAGGVTVQACVSPCAFGASVTPSHSDTSELSPVISGRFVVSSPADNNASDGGLTLREALLAARGGTGPVGLNRAASAAEQVLLGGCTFSAGLITGGCGPGINDTIVFSAGLGVRPVITLTAPLPAITDTAPTRLDGTINGVLPVLNASGAVTDALLIASSSNVLTGLTVTGAPQDDVLLTGNSNQVLTGTVLLAAGRYGLHLSGGAYNRVDSAQVGACGAGNAQGGLVLDSSAMTNTITATLVACNSGVGLRLDGLNTRQNRVVSSTVTGQAGNGVEIVNSASLNQVNSTTIISSSQAGLLISGAATSYNLLQTDHIGVTAAGAPAGNGQYGARLSAGTFGNSFGCLCIAGAGTIASNGLGGVRIETGAHGNDLSANISLNAGPGVVIDSAPNNTVGDSVYPSFMSVWGNLGPGVWVTNSTGTILGPWLTGVLSNTGPGVELINSSHSVIAPTGGISYNGGAGVVVAGLTATNNLIRPLAFIQNAGLPIDLGNDGPTPNGAHAPPGPNDWLPYPVITAASGSVLTGTACLSCTIFIYQAFGNPAAPGGGANYLQAVPADGAGHWHATLTGGLTSTDVTLQACQGTCGGYPEPAADTSELSPRPRLWLPLMRR